MKNAILNNFRSYCYTVIVTNGIIGFYSAIFRSKDADRITNRVDTDKTAP